MYESLDSQNQGVLDYDASHQFAYSLSVSISSSGSLEAMLLDALAFPILLHSPTPDRLSNFIPFPQHHLLITLLSLPLFPTDPRSWSPGFVLVWHLLFLSPLLPLSLLNPRETLLWMVTGMMMICILLLELVYLRSRNFTIWALIISRPSGGTYPKMTWRTSWQCLTKSSPTKLLGGST